ncbi:MAG TPA: hypothetical protein VLK85_28145 [Ramlibacter sp.]|nr:hypothetical protein [Ramlibacter sp.]
MLDDNSVGWQHRGQYAIWTGASAEGTHHCLLERIGNKVARIAHDDGRPVLHRIAAGVAFTIENFMGYWLTLDSDAMWLDTPGRSGRYALLAVGGAAGKPGGGVVDWTCPRCGSAIRPRALDIAPMGFKSFLSRAETLAAEFDAEPQLRTCGSCGALHPVVS